MVVLPPTTLPAAAHATSSDTGPIFDAGVGIDLQHVDQLPVSVIAGRIPEPGSQTEIAVTIDFLRRIGMTTPNASALLGTEVTLGAPRTFGVQRRNRVRWSRAEIVGVVSQEASNGLYVVSLELARAERAWTIAGTPDDAFESSLSPYSALFVVARGLDRVTDVRAEINRVGFSTSAPESLITQVQRYVHVVELVLAGIGFIGLAIAALGISNAMLAAIRERRREIGVLKAVGAADRDVRRVFLVEAGTLGFAGCAGRGDRPRRRAHWRRSSTATCRAKTCRPSTSVCRSLCSRRGRGRDAARARRTLPAIRRRVDAGTTGDRRRSGRWVTHESLASAAPSTLVALARIGDARREASSTGSAPGRGAGREQPPEPKQTVLTIGENKTPGRRLPDRLQDAWPYLVFHDAFPLSTVFVNGALDEATVADAIETQAPPRRS